MNILYQMHSFYTITSISEGIYKEKGSKFISIAYPVTDTEEIKNILLELKKEYYNARHICYAYRLLDEEAYRYNDDGEPSGTAGKPIYGQILSQDLYNILIVVVRYFGGIKLGTGGLIKAYKEAAFDAIKEAEVIEKKIYIPYSLSFQYDFLNHVMRIIKEEDILIKNQEFIKDCTIAIEVTKENEEKVISKLTNIQGLKIN